jgi:hypothetical protein
MRLSPSDPLVGLFRVSVGDAELGLGHFDAAIDENRKAIDSGLHAYFVYTDLAAADAYAGKMDEAKAAFVESRRLNPKLPVKWMAEHTPNCPARVRRAAHGGAARGMSAARRHCLGECRLSLRRE